MFIWAGVSTTNCLHNVALPQKKTPLLNLSIL